MVKWQPVMLVMEKRLECPCGALAIFVVLDNQHEDDFGYEAYCQECWVKSQQEEEYEYPQ